jgi:hypothetical protein
MTRITAVVLLALLASAAAADDFDQAAYNAAVLKHAACTEAAAVELAKKDGEASDLAREALQACKAEEAEIAKLAPPEIFQRVLRNVRYLRVRTIIEVRAGPDPNRCGDCGFLHRWEWDERLRVWRRQGR